MTTITVEDAQSTLADLLEKLVPGEEVVITKDDQPVARLIGGGPNTRELGTMRGTVTYMAPDFDEPLEDFREYME